MYLFRKKKGASGFSSSSTAEEVTQEIDGSGLTAIVTGATSGIGTETVRVLALRGVHVIMGVRNVDAGTRVKQKIMEKIPATEKLIDVMELDLSSMASLRKFASDFNALKLPLNILINNAGIFAVSFTLSKDNIELHFATNHLCAQKCHFLLTNLLLETKKKTARESNVEGRIINVSSMSHDYRGEVNFDKINDRTVYDKFYAYVKSKLANVLHTNELARRLKEEGVNITANSLHPGIIYTNIFQHMSIIDGILSTICGFLFQNVHQGAATSCYVALHPQVKGLSGEYFEGCNVAKAGLLARDVELVNKLWDVSINLINN